MTRPRPHPGCLIAVLVSLVAWAVVGVVVILARAVVAGRF
jgi:hypothetical protein